MQKDTPILINVPHSSVFIPPEEEPFFTIPDLKHELDVMTDHCCDDLFNTGDTMLCFPVSRLVCDPERFRDDPEEIMASVGMGAIYTKSSDGRELRKISFGHKEKLLNRYYDSYHKQFEAAVESKLSKYGKCIIIDGHSFYDEPLPYEYDQDRNRPDICIGTDDHHTPPEMQNAVCWYFRSMGYSVELNRPFAGCIVPLKYYRSNQRVMSIMIEINRRLYMDHDMNKTNGYIKVKKDVADVINLIKGSIS